MYNWQHKSWPHFKLDTTGLDRLSMAFILKAGELTGALSALPKDIETETVIQVLVYETLKTSAIEGEILSRKEVMSSIRKNLGLASTPKPTDKNAIGLSKMLIDVRNTYREPLTETKLLEWHQLLMGNNKKIHAGQWRAHTEPMQVISDSAANPAVHFEAPPSKLVPAEIKRFIQWFNNTETSGQADYVIAGLLVRAAIAHLYFESIHPFEDGNGRIGRAIAEKALSQGIGRPVMFSLSKKIEEKRKEYYKELQQAQQGLEITLWTRWFAGIVVEAQAETEKAIHFTLKKVKFFDQYGSQLNDRQNKVINRMLEEAPNEFQGGMNANKYMGLTGVSKATATRDLQYLADIKALLQVGGGRSTRYDINL